MESSLSFYIAGTLTNFCREKMQENLIFHTYRSGAAIIVTSTKDCSGSSFFGGVLTNLCNVYAIKSVQS